MEFGQNTVQILSGRVLVSDKLKCPKCGVCDWEYFTGEGRLPASIECFNCHYEMVIEE